MRWRTPCPSANRRNAPRQGPGSPRTSNIPTLGLRRVPVRGEHNRRKEIMASTPYEPAVPTQPTPEEAGWGLTGTRRTVAVAAVLAAVVLAVLDAGDHQRRAADDGPVAAGDAGVVGLDRHGLPDRARDGLAAVRGARGEPRAVAVSSRWALRCSRPRPLWCALAPALPWLVAARLPPGPRRRPSWRSAVALLRLVVPPHRLGAAIGWNALVVALSSAAGPTIGAGSCPCRELALAVRAQPAAGGRVLFASRALPESRSAPRAGSTGSASP